MPDDDHPAEAASSGWDLSAGTAVGDPKGDARLGDHSGRLETKGSRKLSETQKTVGCSGHVKLWSQMFDKSCQVGSREELTWMHGRAVFYTFYVDNVLVCGPPEVIKGCLGRVTEEWSCFQTEYFSEKDTLRFFFQQTLLPRQSSGGAANEFSGFMGCFYTGQFPDGHNPEGKIHGP